MEESFKHPANLHAKAEPKHPIKPETKEKILDIKPQDIKKHDTLLKENKPEK